MERQVWAGAVWEIVLPIVTGHVEGLLLAAFY
jgi:hypothetical protein